MAKSTVGVFVAKQSWYPTPGFKTGMERNSECVFYLLIDLSGRQVMQAQ